MSLMLSLVVMLFARRNAVAGRCWCVADYHTCKAAAGRNVVAGRCCCWKCWSLLLLEVLSLLLLVVLVAGSAGKLATLACEDWPC